MEPKKEWIKKHADMLEKLKLDPEDTYEEFLWQHKYAEECKKMGLDPDKEMWRLCKQEAEKNGDKYGSHGPLPKPGTKYPKQKEPAGDEVILADPKTKLKKFLKTASKSTNAQKKGNLSFLPQTREQLERDRKKGRHVLYNHNIKGKEK